MPEGSGYVGTGALAAFLLTKAINKIDWGGQP